MSDIFADSRDAAPLPTLSSTDRRALRARAHDLDPVVRVGDAGLTDAVIAEIDRALSSHGLIKVQIFGDEREARQAMATEIELRVRCALVQAIGKRVVLWRPRPEDAAPAAPARPVRRPILGVPKKLAAEGKTAPRRRVRPGLPQMPRASADPASRRDAAGARGTGTAGARPSGKTTPRSAGSAMPRGAAAPSPRGTPLTPSRPRQGPGMRTSRGALDGSAARPAGSGARPGRSSGTGPGPTGAGKRPGPAAQGPRVVAPKGRTPASKTGLGAPKGRSPSAAPKGAAAARPPGAGSGSRRPTGNAASGRGAPAAPRSGSGRATSATGSARPGSRTRAGRRGP